MATRTSSGAALAYSHFTRERETAIQAAAVGRDFAIDCNAVMGRFLAISKQYSLTILWYLYISTVLQIYYLCIKQMAQTALECKINSTPNLIQLCSFALTYKDNVTHKEKEK